MPRKIRRSIVNALIARLRAPLSCSAFCITRKAYLQIPVGRCHTLSHSAPLKVIGITQPDVPALAPGAGQGEADHREDRPARLFLNTNIWFQGQDPNAGSDSMAAFITYCEQIRRISWAALRVSFYEWGNPPGTFNVNEPDYFPAENGLANAVSTLRGQGWN